MHNNVNISKIIIVHLSAVILVKRFDITYTPNKELKNHKVEENIYPLLLIPKQKRTICSLSSIDIWEGGGNFII